MPLPLQKYKDLDLSLTPHAITGKLLALKDVEAVKRSVRQLVLTNNYERFFQPDIGSNVTSYLFSPSTTPFTARQIESNVEDAIKAYERRANLISVKCNLDQDGDANTFRVTIKFSIKTITEEVELVMFLKRVR